jgi:phage tail sheath protein FI
MTIVEIVRGAVTAQYIQNLLFTTPEPWSESQLNKGMAKKDATNVAGKNATVTAASVFMEDESRLLAEAKVLESLARVMFSLASSWAIKLKSYRFFSISILDMLYISRR